MGLSEVLMFTLAIILTIATGLLIVVATWTLWNIRMREKRRFKSWDESLLPITVFFSDRLSNEGVASLREAIADVNAAMGFTVFDTGNQVERSVEERFEERVGLEMELPKGIFLYAPCVESEQTAGSDTGLVVRLIRNAEGYIEFAYTRVPLYIEYTTEHVYRLLFIVLGSQTLLDPEHLLGPEDVDLIRRALADTEPGRIVEGSVVKEA